MKYHADYTCDWQHFNFSNGDDKVLNQADLHLAHLKALPHRLKLQLVKDPNIPCLISKIYQYFDILAIIRFPKYARNVYLWQKLGAECQRLLKTD